MKFTTTTPTHDKKAHLLSKKEKLQILCVVNEVFEQAIDMTGSRIDGRREEKMYNKYQECVLRLLAQQFGCLRTYDSLDNDTYIAYIEKALLETNER